ncbi:hypothetical protein NL676_039641 [Syzygium grande]|nr:hypothetical protein NL676_039641 [Syzygium grande]
MPDIRAESLTGNNFSGTIKIANLTSLQFLSVSNNQFIRSLDWNYSSIANLEVFNAYSNNFTGLLPMVVLDLKKIRCLSLGRQLLSRENPRKLRGISGYGVLVARGEWAERKSTEQAGNLTELKEMYLGYYSVFEGGLPGDFGNLIKKFHMGHSTCGLDGAIPPELGNLKKLHTLYLQFNLLSGLIRSKLAT